MAELNINVNANTKGAVDGLNNVATAAENLGNTLRTTPQAKVRR